ncbi:minor capsid protein [Streptomyces sp. NBC_01016]|uniref:minor capsid protein n=1 Tax=Streptomyces sp. NBC_01016 TaxID=2903720 RepID=UPI002257030F|nr:minor capsid protein [Streptomyces sp. NBC_01016]MCX4827187.1 minor capsid protein [Streptomyces sp. NBC_01016]
MSYTSSLLGGIAGLLIEAGVGVYRPDAVISDPDTGIFRGVMPATPERALGITDYPVEDGGGTDVITGVQIRMRAGRDPDAIADLADAVFGVLHMREHYSAGGVDVALSWRQSQAWIGQDAHGRMELTSNYYFRTSRPGPHQHE